MGGPKTEWWKTFFSGITLDLWRQAVTEEQTRMEADFIEKTLASPTLKRVWFAEPGTAQAWIAATSPGDREPTRVIFKLTGVGRV
ncbi:MAG: hypothetical protein HY314_09680 [Acidobacteria bacterium]|nr:hypothetical protein [Acidobacteriota bacterium]